MDERRGHYAAVEMITVAEYAAHRGCSAPRIRKLIRDGRLDAAIVRERHGKKDRVFLTSAEAADHALERTAAGPRGKTAMSAPAVAPSATVPNEKGRPGRMGNRRRITDIKPEEMTRPEAIDAKAIYDSEQSRLKKEKLQMENNHAAGLLVDVATAARQNDAWTARVVAGLGALPARVAQSCPDAPATLIAAVRREVDRLRRQLAADDG